VNSVFHAALAAIVVCLTPGIDVSAEDRFLEQEPDSYIKLGDIKGEYRSDEYRSDEYRSDPDSYIKLGDIKGEYRSDEYRSDEYCRTNIAVTPIPTSNWATSKANIKLVHPQSEYMLRIGCRNWTT
jgi:hypothetical protein